LLVDQEIVEFLAALDRSNKPTWRPTACPSIPGLASVFDWSLAAQISIPPGLAPKRPQTSCWTLSIVAGGRHTTNAENAQKRAPAPPGGLFIVAI
jgi:hypothetical protein